MADAKSIGKGEVVQADRELIVRLQACRVFPSYSREVEYLIPAGLLADTIARLTAQPVTVASPGYEIPWQDAKAIAASVVQSACETDPADADHPNTILICTDDLETIVRNAVENHELKPPSYKATHVCGYPEHERLQHPSTVPTNGDDHG